MPLTASFHPEDPTSLLVTGKNLYKYFKINESSMRITHPMLVKKSKCQASSHYTTHVWFDKRILISTVGGEILIAELSGEFKMMLSSSPGF